VSSRLALNGLIEERQQSRAAPAGDCSLAFAAVLIVGGDDDGSRSLLARPGADEVGAGSPVLVGDGCFIHPAAVATGCAEGGTKAVKTRGVGRRNSVNFFLDGVARGGVIEEDAGEGGGFLCGDDGRD
jgi:hypothetical protein